MSVQEQYVIAVSGPDDGLSIAHRLAARSGARLRWAAVWTVRPLDLGLFSSPPWPSSDPHCLGFTMVCVPNPTMEDVHRLIAHAGDEPLCIHYSPRMYTFDEGPDPVSIPFVDSNGYVREGGTIYAIELACNAVPLTTVDRPQDENLCFGPTLASGWALRLVVIRDHLPRTEILRWLATAANVAHDRVHTASP